MTGCYKARDGFARQAEVNELRMRPWESGAKIRLDGLHVFAAVSNAIAQKHDAGLKKHLGLSRDFPRRAHRSQSNLLHVHDRAGLLPHRSDRQGMRFRFPQIHLPEVARREILKVSGFLDDKVKFLAADFDLGVASALSFPAALPDLDLERAGLRDRELPFRPIARVYPVAETVLIRQGFVAQHDAVR